jgi:hypothetical protein
MTSSRKQTVINVDGTISPTAGQCKEGMDISYNGKWGYHPLVISLANTHETSLHCQPFGQCAFSPGFIALEGMSQGRYPFQSHENF